MKVGDSVRVLGMEGGDVEAIMKYVGGLGIVTRPLSHPPDAWFVDMGDKEVLTWFYEHELELVDSVLAFNDKEESAHG